MRDGRSLTPRWTWSIGRLRWKCWGEVLRCRLLLTVFPLAVLTSHLCLTLEVSLINPLGVICSLFEEAWSGVVSL